MLHAGQTVGLFLNEPGAHQGYTLWSPLSQTDTFLIDNEGRFVHSWPSAYNPGLMPYLVENGDLVRAASGGGVQRIAWDGTLLWEYFYNTPDYRQHHDIEPLPNGNVLLIAWQILPASEAIVQGRNPANLDPAEFWPLHIVEVEPVGTTGGNIVWEWYLWDHLIQDFDPTKLNFGTVGDHPELVDINLQGGNKDWVHANSIDYDPTFDQILISCSAISEIWVIDHSTTTAEAAGHTGGNSGKGGDLLYRWGNPQNYRRGGPEDRRLFSQHDAKWVPPGSPGAGNIVLFSNGGGRPGGSVSTVEEIAPPVDGSGNYTIGAGVAFGPADPTWTYTPDPPFYEFIMSGAQRLPNGNTMVTRANSGEFFEIDALENVVWSYVNPIGPLGPVEQGDPSFASVFRADRIAIGDPRLAGKDLTPGDPLELFDPLQPPDGLACSRTDASGTQIDCTWGVAPCTPWDHNLLYGSFADVSSYTLAGAECGIGTGGAHSWSGVPAGDLFFLIVGTDECGVYESDWGGGTAASGLCGVQTKDLSGSCP